MFLVPRAVLTVLQAGCKPRCVNLAFQSIGFKCMLDRDLLSILLAQKSSDQRSWLVAQRVSSDVVRNCEDNERVKRDFEA